MYSNTQILAAVLQKWLQPAAIQILQSKVQSMPFVQLINNKVRSTGWVNPQWSIIPEVAPFLEPVANSMVQPVLKSMLAKVPDEAVPAMAHSIVDKALEQGQLSILDGFITLDRTDLEELKKLLNYNLPLKAEAQYTVKTQPDAEAQAAQGPEQNN